MIDSPLDKFIKKSDKQRSEYGIIIKSNFKENFTLRDANNSKELMSRNETEFLRWALTMAMQYPETPVGRDMAKSIANSILNKKETNKQTNIFTSLNGLSLDQLKEIEEGNLNIDDLYLDDDGVYRSKREAKKEKTFEVNAVIVKDEKIDRPDIGKV